MKDKLSFTIIEAVQATGICRSRIYAEISEGRLRLKKCGRRSVITATDLRDWLEALPSSTAYRPKAAFPDNNAA